MRQSKDCTVTRPAMPAPRTACATARAKARARALSWLPGASLVSMLKRDMPGAGALRELEHLGERRDAGAVGRLLGREAAA